MATVMVVAVAWCYPTGSSPGEACEWVGVDQDGNVIRVYAVRR